MPGSKQLPDEKREIRQDPGTDQTLISQNDTRYSSSRSQDYNNQETTTGHLDLIIGRYVTVSQDTELFWFINHSVFSIL